MLTAGQVHDVVGGRALLATVPAMSRLIGDMAYDANDVRDVLAAQGDRGRDPAQVEQAPSAQP